MERQYTVREVAEPERQYTVKEVAARWGVGEKYVYTHFLHVPGVLRLPSENPLKTRFTRPYFTWRIPEPILLREEKLLKVA